LSLTSPATQPSKEQVAAQAAREKAEMDKILPKVRAEDKEAENYYHTVFIHDTDNPLEDFTFSSKNRIIEANASSAASGTKKNASADAALAKGGKKSTNNHSSAEVGKVQKDDKEAINSSQNVSKAAGDQEDTSAEAGNAWKDSLKAVNKAAGDQEGTSSIGSSSVKYSRFITQLIFGLVYYILIVRKYPELKDAQPSSHAVELQERNEVMATCHVSGRNCLLSWCCSGPRAAHTFHSVGVLNYWPSLCFMTFLPCCTLCLMNAMSDLNVKLGGRRRNFCMSCLCSCCCSCCVIAQDAEALDLTTGARTGLCGVYENA